MLTLSNLKPHRLHRAYPRHLLAAVTGIPLKRLSELELKKAEPWFDEALILARALCLPSLLDLMASDDLTDFESNPTYFAGDVRFWRSGVRLALPLALRIARRFGVARPDDLDVGALTRQIWSVLEATERHPEAPGWCAWCRADIVAGEPHSDACLPHNLLGSRASHGFTSEAEVGEIRPGRSGTRRGTARAHGIKAIREGLGLTQKGMGELIGYNPNHYSRIERTELPLLLEKATELALRLDISRDSIYLHPPLPSAPPGP